MSTMSWNGTNGGRAGKAGAAVFFGTAVCVIALFGVWLRPSFAASSGAEAQARAESLYAKEDYRGAIEEFSRALAENPRLASAMGGRANAKCMQRDFKGCAADAGASLALDGSNTSQLWTRGLARFELGDYKGAIEDNDEILRRSPSTRAMMNRALAKIRIKDMRGAEADARSALTSAKDAAERDEAAEILKSMGAPVEKLQPDGASASAVAPSVQSGAIMWRHPGGALELQVPAGMALQDKAAGEDWDAVYDKDLRLMVFLWRKSLEGEQCSSFSEQAYLGAPGRNVYSETEQRRTVVFRRAPMEKMFYWDVCLVSGGRTYMAEAATPESGTEKMPAAANSMLIPKRVSE